MNCKYFYNGLKFDSEEKLNDFFLGNGKDFFDKYGDEVYEKIPVGARNLYDMLEEIKNKFKLQHKAGVEIRKKILKSYDPILESYDVNLGTGITKFLEGLRRANGDLYFPEFIKENYFNVRRQDWIRGKFKGSELKDFEDIWTPDSGKEITSSMLDLFLKRIEEKWEFLRKAGTAIHSILLYYFTNENYKLDIKLIKENLKNRLSGEIKAKYISRDTVEAVVDYAVNLQKHLESDKVYGKNLTYYPEFIVLGEVLNPETETTTNLIGMVDLLVLDARGNVHIIDYKTSPNDYSKVTEDDYEIDGYSAAKILAFEYQLEVYNRMIRLYGFTRGGSDINVAPIRMTKFLYKNGRWQYESIEYLGSFIDNLSKNIERTKRRNEKLDDLFIERQIIETSGENIISDVMSQMRGLFDGFTNNKERTLDEAKKIVEDKAYEIKEEGKWVLELGKRSNLKVFEAEDKEKLTTDLLKYLQHWRSNMLHDTLQIKSILLTSVEDDEILFSEKREADTGSLDWLENLIKKYKTYYHVVDTPAQFDELGVIVLLNNITNNIEILKISSNCLHLESNFASSKLGKRKKLTACWQDDTIEDSNSDSYMLDAVYGNFDLIEAILTINTQPKLFRRFGKAKISKIQVINPELNSGLTASNRELEYTFKTLCRIAKDASKIEHNYIGSKDIEFCSLVEVFLDELSTLLSAIPKTSKLNNIAKPDNWAGFNIDETEHKLNEIREQLEKAYGAKLMTNMREKSMRVDDLDNPEVVLYRDVLIALASLHNLNYRQQWFDPAKLVQSFNILKEGHAGLYTDNPGTTASKNLNTVTSFIKECYQNVRHLMAAEVAAERKLVQKLKNEAEFSYLKERTYGNRASLYEGMTQRTSDGDWLFVKPETLQGAKREFLEFMLKKINSQRLANYSEATVEKLKLDYDPRYYRVPLVYGDSSSRLYINGITNTVELMFKNLMPGRVKERLKESFDSIFSNDPNDITEEKVQNLEVLKMINGFENSENVQYRRFMLNDTKKYGLAYFEQDLEKVLLKHMYNYTVMEEMNKIFPLIKAATAFLAYEYATQNKMYSNSMQYLFDYVKAKVMNRRLDPDKSKLVGEYGRKLMQAASVLALGFAPVLVYLCVEGLWKDISLVIRKPDGTNAFTKENMTAAFCDVFKELIHFGNGRSKLELINEFYALNDLDTNMYALRLQDGHSLFHDFTSFLFRFTLRPDFYNRLTIFEAQMRGDGCWEAHSVENGQLKYDWAKDERYKYVALKMVNHPKYKELLVHYRETIKLMRAENTTVIDENTGKKRLIRFGDPLPKAYTTKESEAYKAMSDMMYGYYSSEKKSLMQSYLIGALFFQMYTYWSGKKNQYFAPGSVKNQGKMNIAKNENGEKLYYQVNELGEILYDLPLTTEETAAPAWKWEGQFSEGIAVTLFNMGVGMRGLLVKNHENFGQAFNEIWDKYYNNPNENLRLAYRSNLKLFAYDSFMFMIVGGIFGSLLHQGVNNYVKSTKDNKTIQLAFLNTNLMLADNIFKHSILDFNFMDSIFGRGISINPFASEMMVNLVDNWAKCLEGEKSFKSAVINSTSATRQTKELWKFIIPDKEKDSTQEKEEKKSNVVSFNPFGGTSTSFASAAKHGMKF